MSLGNFDTASAKSSTTFANLSYSPGLDAVPNTRHSSTKNIPSQLNHCRTLSAARTLMCLYASAQSAFVIKHPLPALFSTAIHFAVEDITVGKSPASIPSFTDFPSGADMFSITLTAPLGFGLHIIPLTLACAGTSSLLNGPAAKPFSNQPPTASVICSGYCRQLAAFPLTVGPLATPRQPISAPCSKS